MLLDFVLHNFFFFESKKRETKTNWINQSNLYIIKWNRDVKILKYILDPFRTHYCYTDDCSTVRTACVCGQMNEHWNSRNTVSWTRNENSHTRAMLSPLYRWLDLTQSLVHVVPWGFNFFLFLTQIWNGKYIWIYTTHTLSVFWCVYSYLDPRACVCICARVCLKIWAHAEWPSNKSHIYILN